MTNSLIFKKYANRRLYSMSDSKYVTLGDMSELICKGHEVKVIDAKTKEDARLILTQIILEQTKNKNTLCRYRFCTL